MFRVLDTIKQFIEILKDIICPADEIILEIEKMSLGEFCQKTEFSFTKEEKLFFLMPYRNKYVNASIRELKKKGNNKIANLLGHCLEETIIEESDNLKKFYNFYDYIIIPIPRDPERVKFFKIDQNLLVLEKAKLIKNFKIPIFKDILKRIHTKKHQSETRNKKERLKNMKNVFYVNNAKRIVGRNILLFDDISTTGATLDNAEIALKKAGARRVIKITLAH